MKHINKVTGSKVGHFGLHKMFNETRLQVLYLIKFKRNVLEYYLIIFQLFVPKVLIYCCYKKNFLQDNMLVESFYSVNYVKVNYFIKYLTVDCKHLLFLKSYSLD